MEFYCRLFRRARISQRPWNEFLVTLWGLEEATSLATDGGTHV